MDTDYKKLVEFWNQSFVISHDDKKNMKDAIKTENDWKDLAPSSKLFDVLISFKDLDNVLDYGAGSGWASIIMAKSGVKHIDAVDVAKNSIEMIKFYSEIFEESDKIKPILIDETWLGKQDSNKYDGLFCSNVLDVIPYDMAKDIVKQCARIVKKGAKVIFSFNYYIDPKAMEQKGFSVSDSYIYINGILRLNSIDEVGWTNLFKKYFQVEKIDYFAWPGEEKETRRLFVLRK